MLCQGTLTACSYWLCCLVSLSPTHPATTPTCARWCSSTWSQSSVPSCGDSSCALALSSKSPARRACHHDLQHPKPRWGSEKSYSHRLVLGRLVKNTAPPSGFGGVYKGVSGKNGQRALSNPVGWTLAVCIPESVIVSSNLKHYPYLPSLIDAIGSCT